jgi:hypothetical protein
MRMIPAFSFCGALIALGLALSSGNALAQTDGKLGKLLEQALTAAAKGQCPPSIMSPMLRGTCEQQMPQMGQNLAQMGPITNTEFLGVQPTPMGQAEVYRVNFQSNQMMWMINQGTDGKIMVLWSPG